MRNILDDSVKRSQEQDLVLVVHRNNNHQLGLPPRLDLPQRIMILDEIIRATGDARVGCLKHFLLREERTEAFLELERDVKAHDEVPVRELDVEFLLLVPASTLDGSCRRWAPMRRLTRQEFFFFLLSVRGVAFQFLIADIAALFFPRIDELLEVFVLSFPIVAVVVKVPLDRFGILFVKLHVPRVPFARGFVQHGGDGTEHVTRSMRVEGGAVVSERGGYGQIFIVPHRGRRPGAHRPTSECAVPACVGNGRGKSGFLFLGDRVFGLATAKEPADSRTAGSEWCCWLSV